MYYSYPIKVWKASIKLPTNTPPLNESGPYKIDLITTSQCAHRPTALLLLPTTHQF